MENKKAWLWAGAAVVVLLSFVFSDSFWNTISRRRALQKMDREYEHVSSEVELARAKLTNLENNPGAYEQLVRKELGYLRPGEKEVRFLDKNN